MTIRDVINRIAVGWESYHQKRTVDREDPVYALVVGDFPQALRPLVSAFEFITVEGKTGAGNITAAPWIALFDQRLTTSATQEYYVVYLFSTDMSAVTLCIAFGTTQFEEQFGSPTEAFPRMRSAAIRLQEMFNHLIPPNMERGPINLQAKPHEKLHQAYQKASILSYPPYRIASLPPEHQLEADLQGLVQIYTEIVSDPLEATVDQLVEAVIEPAARVDTIEVCEFEPRPPHLGRAPIDPKKRRRKGSPESRKVGDAGERVVVKYERERLIGLGKTELADRVRWHAEEREFVGWDVTSFEDDGSPFYIEVKSSVGRAFSSFGLTVNEWKAACDPVRRDHYISRHQSSFSYAAY
jgi:MrcB-like, N-terminal domain/Domain of unknown function (DUF3883)